MFESNHPKPLYFTKALQQHDLDSVRELLSKSDSVVVGRRSLLQSQDYCLDEKDGEAIIGVYERELVGAIAVKRTHFSWDIWGIGAIAVDPGKGAVGPSIRLLLASAQKHMRANSSGGQCLAVVASEQESVGLLPGFQELYRFPAPSNHTLLIQSLTGTIQTEAALQQPRPPRSISLGVVVRPLDDPGIIASADLVEQVWGKDDSALFVEENLRYRQQGAMVCGAFTERGELVGAATIKQSYFDEKVWGLAWAVVAPDQQRIGIGSQMTEYRLQHAREQTPNGMAITVTSNPDHSVKNGFAILARYGNQMEKRILMRQL